MSERISLNSSPQAQSSDDAWVPPVTDVALPSMGKLYPPESPLFMAETLDVRAMTAREENILTSRPLLKKGTALTALMKACITNKTVDPDQMVVGDRNAVMVAIRISAYGAEYNFEVDCTSCEQKKMKQTFDLSKQVKLVRLSIEPETLGSNCFRFTLPVMKRDVRFKFLNGIEERQLSADQEHLKKVRGLGAPEENVTTRLHAQCISIGDETDKTKLLSLIERMPAADARAWRQHIDRAAPGIDMLHTFECPACNQEQEVDVPMGAEFFWPKS